MCDVVWFDVYYGGIFDMGSGYIYLLWYVLGFVWVCLQVGVMIYEQICVIDIYEGVFVMVKIE